MKKWVDGEVLDMTEAEIAEVERLKKMSEIQRKTNPYSAMEVLELLLKSQINTMSLDDKQAVRAKVFYPSFEDVAGKTVVAGFKFTYNDQLYKVVQSSLVIPAYYPPGQGTESMYEMIDEAHTGTEEAPILYNRNMALENGKYYFQNMELYRCIRDTVNPVYHDLADLVGIYVDIA